MKLSKKIAVRHKLDRLKIQSPLDFQDIDMNCVELYLDISTNPEDVLEIFTKDLNHFRIIVREILLGRYSDSHYRKEADGVSAMKFLGKINSRIYCQENKTADGKRKVVIMSKPLTNKNADKNDKKIKDLIESIQKTEFILCQTYEEAKQIKL